MNRPPTKRASAERPCPLCKSPSPRLRDGGRTPAWACPGCGVVFGTAEAVVLKRSTTAEATR